MSIGKIIKGELTKKHKTDAGLDIKSAETVMIPAGQAATISTGLHIIIPIGFVGIIKSRSSLAVMHDIEVGAGVIDSGYMGEVKVKLRNFSKKDYRIIEGDRIAQLLTIPATLEYYVNAEESVSDRGEGGFGSTGK